MGQPGILNSGPDPRDERQRPGRVCIPHGDPSPPDQLDDAALDQELQASKHALEEITGKDVQAIAYPYSDYDQRVCTAAAKYYRFGYIDWPKNYYAQYEIGRTPVRRDITIEQFEALLH